MSSDPAENQEAWRWDADLEGVSRHWWKSDWVATPAPTIPTEPTLIPIVTTASEISAVEVAQVYTHRWPAQENSIRDFLVSLGLDTPFWAVWRVWWIADGLGMLVLAPTIVMWVTADRRLYKTGAGQSQSGAGGEWCHGDP